MQIGKWFDRLTMTMTHPLVMCQFEPVEDLSVLQIGKWFDRLTMTMTHPFVMCQSELVEDLGVLQILIAVLVVITNKGTN